mmetsp:Transcript_93230/g.161995  ORF Transcript_93230/g.161995 Transcript_93230/m.161995 type:complete len:204 (-) Transcript_93230:490-1101(-)
MALLAHLIYGDHRALDMQRRQVLCWSCSRGSGLSRFLLGCLLFNLWLVFLLVRLLIFLFLPLFLFRFLLGLLLGLSCLLLSFLLCCFSLSLSLRLFVVLLLLLILLLFFLLFILSTSIRLLLRTWWRICFMGRFSTLLRWWWNLFLFSLLCLCLYLLLRLCRLPACLAWSTTLLSFFVGFPICLLIGFARSGSCASGLNVSCP